MPKIKRHIKATQASSSPATDGKHVVAFFGSEGLYCYDINGKLVWEKDLGVLDTGWFYDPDYQWGTASSPIIYKDMVIVQCDVQNYAIRAGAAGDISLKPNETTNQHIAWSMQRGGTYMPTPLIYGEYLYTCANQGVMACYNPKTGERLYQQRIGVKGGAYSASPVAADCKIYLSSEDGEIFVVKAGPKYELLATNQMGEVLMATPAISDGMIFVRGRNSVFAVAERGPVSK